MDTKDFKTCEKTFAGHELQAGREEHDQRLSTNKMGLSREYQGTAEQEHTGGGDEVKMKEVRK